jgi:hypothetical protein
MGIDIYTLKWCANVALNLGNIYAVAIITHLLGRISEKEHSWKGGPATQSNA